MCSLGLGVHDLVLRGLTSCAFFSGLHLSQTEASLYWGESYLYLGCKDNVQNVLGDCAGLVKWQLQVLHVHDFTSPRELPQFLVSGVISFLLGRQQDQLHSSCLPRGHECPRILMPLSTGERMTCVQIVGAEGQTSIWNKFPEHLLHSHFIRSSSIDFLWGGCTGLQIQSPLSRIQFS